MAAKGKTVAVFGTGVDVLYPKENTRLGGTNFGARRSADFRVSSRHLRRPAELSYPQSHHQRHVHWRVVEAAEYSATRITARCALGQKRDVFAVPGTVTNKNSWGPNTLIKQGARLVATCEDLWEELPENIPLALTPAQSDESNQSETASLFPVDNPLSPHERRIFAHAQSG